jgi:hypothetical protein
MIDGSDLLQLVCDKLVALVEEQDAELQQCVGISI